MADATPPATSDAAKNAYQRWLDATKAASAAPAQGEAAAPADPAKEEGVKKIADMMRERAKADGSYSPQQDSVFSTTAKAIYDNPELRKMYLGSETEQAEAARKLNQQQQSNVAGEMHKLSGQDAQKAKGEKGQATEDNHNMAPDDAKAKVMGIMDGMLSGKGPGMQPSPDSGGRTSRPAETTSPVAVSAEEVAARGHDAEHKLAEFIRAHQAESPTHVVDMGKKGIGNPELQQEMQAYSRYLELSQQAGHKEPLTKDRALIEQNNYGNFVNNHMADPKDHTLLIPPKDLESYRRLSAEANEADKAGMTQESFGIHPQPKAGPSR